MKDCRLTGQKLGIMAGGQLASMIINAVNPWSIETFVLDANPKCPAARLACNFTVGNHRNLTDVLNFAAPLDVILCEIESVNSEALHHLQEQGKRVVPDPSILKMVQDKGRQKLFYKEHGFPTADFSLFSNRNELIEAIESGKISLPFVLKLRCGGYDGKGVIPVDGNSEADKLFDKPTVAEDKVDIAMEISVIAARNVGGELECFPPVEMVFDKEANLVDTLWCPANLDDQLAREATQISKDLCEALNLVGIIAVEFFVTNKGKILINEIAPRPHNSGHHTIEAFSVSQYEQLLRCAFDLPLAPCRMIAPSAMINLLSGGGYEEVIKNEGLKQLLAIEGLYVHFYGKTDAKLKRKMGHITIVGNNRSELDEKVRRTKNIMRS